MSSTLLRDLHPLIALDLQTNRMKNVGLNHGSAKMSLKTPARASTFFRPYQPGDSPFLIDWKAFGRTDHLVIREKNAESKRRITIGLKLAFSMRWPEKNFTSKAEIALRIGCHLAHRHLRDGDSVHLLLFLTEQEPTVIFRLRSITEILGYFEYIWEKGFDPDQALLYRLHPGRINQADHIYYVSDFFEGKIPHALQSKTAHFSMIQVLSSREIFLDWVDSQDVYFAETTKGLDVKGTKLRQPLVKAEIASWLAGVKAQFKKGYFLSTEETPIGRYLDFLRRAI